MPQLELAEAGPGAPAMTVGRAGRDWTITIAMPEGTDDGEAIRARAGHETVAPGGDG